MKVCLSFRPLLITSMAIVGVGCVSESNEQSEHEMNSENANPPLAKLTSGYKSNTNDWEKFLECWNRQIVAHLETEGVSEFDMPVLSFVRSADEQEVILRGLVAADETLGYSLPSSYRDFAKVTNTTFSFYMDYQDRLDASLSNFIMVRDIGLFRKLRPPEYNQWRDAASDGLVPNRYYRYTFSTDPEKSQDSVYFPKSYLDELILIGEIHGHGYLLLNPIEITEDGEMEAWELSWSNPGAVRYRSFAELMQNISVADVGDVMHGSPYPAAVLSRNCASILQTVALKELIE